MRHRTAILHSPIFQQHDTGDHPERIARMVALERALVDNDLLTDRPQITITPAPDEAILRVHGKSMLKRLDHIASNGGGWIDGDTVVRPDSMAVARMSAGGAINAVDAILAGEVDRAVLLTRPPGHHATPDRAMGFCLLNSAAIAAEHALAKGLSRVAILDWDVHHGNGTQDSFYGRSNVFYCSIHQSPLFPGTGFTNEIGTGDGIGTTLNLPVPPGTSGARFIDLIQSVAIPAIDAFAPELLIISAGYDAHQDDPLGSLNVSDTDFDTLMQLAVDLSGKHENQLLVVLEGGYNVEALARCVVGAIKVLDASSSLASERSA